MGTTIQKGLISLAITLLISLPLTISAVEVDKDDFNFLTTEDLYSLCAAPLDDPDFVAAIYSCKGYIAGAVDYHDGISNRKDMKRLICYPQNTTLKEGREAFVAWAKDRESDTVIMGEQAVLGLVKALTAKYPCTD